MPEQFEMAGGSTGWSSERTELVISALLRVGVLCAATVVASGGIFFLAGNGTLIPDYSVFRGEPEEMRTVSGILRDAMSIHARGIIQLGLLILIATPVARVMFSVVAFAMEHDWLYVMVTLVVLGVLVFSLVGWRL